MITAIEVLSPTNKLRYERRSAYGRKRRTYPEGGVNVVEIDLIRDRDYLVLAPDELIPPACFRSATTEDPPRLPGIGWRGQYTTRRQAVPIATKTRETLESAGIPLPTASDEPQGSPRSAERERSKPESTWEKKVPISMDHGAMSEEAVQGTEA